MNGNGNGNGHGWLLGLNVTGPGGGQWTLRLKGESVSELSVGLPHNAPVLEMTIDQFAQSADESTDLQQVGSDFAFTPRPEAWGQALVALFALT